MEMATIGLSRVQKSRLEAEKRRFEGELGGSHLSWGSWLLLAVLGYAALKEIKEKGGKPNESRPESGGEKI